jgi:hypothetical protein
MSFEDIEEYMDEHIFDDSFNEDEFSDLIYKNLEEETKPKKRVRKLKEKNAK